MITIQQITALLKNKLNGVGNPGVTFELFTDTGKFKKSLRNKNAIATKINGLNIVTASQIENTNDGVMVATLTNRCEIIVPCKDEEEDIYQKAIVQGQTVNQLVEYGNDTYISNIRKWLDACTTEQVYTNLTDTDNNTYDVSIAYTLSSTGTREQISPIGDCITFIIFSYCNIIQGGENSRTYQAYLDGQRIPYNNMTIRRVPSQEANGYAENGYVAKSITTSHTLGVTFELPAFISLFNDTIKNYLLNGENNICHILTLKLGKDIHNLEVQKNYLVEFGIADATSSGILNVGQSIALVECADEYGVVTPCSRLFIYVSTHQQETTIGCKSSGAIYSFYNNTFTIGKGEQTANILVGRNSIVISTQTITNFTLIGLQQIVG